MNRKMARETVMQVFYQMDIHNTFDKIIGKKLLEGEIDNDKDINIEYLNQMVNVIVEKKEEVDRCIEKNLKNWTMDRIAKIDLSILRVAVSEILFAEDIPVRVAINEAIELGKRYGTENSPSFINGVLGSLVNENEQVIDDE